MILLDSNHKPHEATISPSTPVSVLPITLKRNSQGPCFKMGSLSERVTIHLESIHTYSILIWTENPPNTAKTSLADYNQG